MTMGDAVSSFLGRADETTEELCLMSRSSLALWHQPPIPQVYRQAKGEEAKWSSTVSASRWRFCMSLLVGLDDLAMPRHANRRKDMLSPCSYA